MGMLKNQSALFSVMLVKSRNRVYNSNQKKTRKSFIYGRFLLFFQNEKRGSVFMSIDLNLYTGKLTYKDIEFDFVFDKSELRLIPPIEKYQEVRKWFLNELQPGAYTSGETVYIEDTFLRAKINETGQTIILFAFHNRINSYNNILMVQVDSYLICKTDIEYIDRIGFRSTEIDYIYATSQALCWPSWNTNGEVSVKTTKFNETESEKHVFEVDKKPVSVFFGITRTTRISDAEPPLELHSTMYFEFEKTNDYSFITKLWSIAKSFIQFLCYRKNVGLPEAVISAPAENGKHCSVATFYVVGETNTVEPNALDKGRYIKQQYIAGYEGEILNDISSNNLYQRHIPLSYEQGHSIDAARFVMITAAFEWEFNRSYPNGVSKKDSTKAIEEKAIAELEKLINDSTGKLKEKYRYLKRQIKSDSLQSKIIQVGKDYADIIDMFGNHLYQINDETLKYSEMGKRLSDQRNHFAHGDLDKDFIGNSLLDLIFLEYVIYTIQLKRYGIPDDNIKKIINDLFRCSIAL